MSSLARRTSVAAAGIAALGVGLAGHAFAAPEVPDLPGADAVDPAAMLEGATAGPPSAPSAEGFSMPGVINFETPNVRTAAPALPSGDPFALPGVPELPTTAALPETPALPDAPALPETSAPALPTSTEGPVEMDLDAELVEMPSTDTPNSPQVGAMQDLDMASLLLEMAQSAAAGESVTEDQQIG